jgi:hypothetical protein
MVNEKKVQKAHFDKLSRDDEDKTKILAGHVTYTIKQLEEEMIDPKSEVGKKLRDMESELEKY